MCGCGTSATSKNTLVRDSTCMTLLRTRQMCSACFIFRRAAACCFGFIWELDPSASIQVVWGTQKRSILWSRAIQFSKFMRCVEEEPFSPRNCIPYTPV